MSEVFDVDLLIVGAGPVGLTASIMASKLGIDHQVLERREGLHELPQAHVIKTRSMEIFRRLGIEQEIHAIGTPHAEQRYTCWCETLTGYEYGRLDLNDKKGPVPRFLSVSPTYPANLPQNRLEPIIFAKARELADDRIRFRTEVDGVVQDSTGVTVQVTDPAGAEQTLRARYLIAADGAGSGIRRSLGIAFEGPSMLAQFCSIHLKSDFRPLVQDRPGVLYWILNPDVQGVFIVHDMRDCQVFMVPYNPEVMKASDFDMDRCRALVESALGVNHPFEITCIDHWTMSAQVAKHYRKDRVFLVGDAAHRFPPTGGLGMNTGIQDVNNLLWKLDAVLKGRTSESLLDSYEEECRPIARYNRDRSAQNHQSMAEVQELIGVGSDKASFRGSLEALFSPGGETRLAAVQNAIKKQIRHFAYMDVEMAPVYATGAFGASVLPIDNGNPLFEGYAPNVNPGSGLPHLYLEEGRSTLDAVSHNALTVFVPAGQARRWRTAVDAAADRNPLPMKVIEITPVAAEQWRNLCGNLDLVVVVRPDGHVGWACDAGTERPEQELEAAIAAIMGAAAPLQDDSNMKGGV